MPRKIEKTVYTFVELLSLVKDSGVTERAVERAREWLREAATDGAWWDSEEEKWKDALDQIGFVDAQISFRGFWSQGDGASFTANLDIERLVDFLSTEITPSNAIVPVEGKLYGHDEDFRGWLVKKLGGKVTNPRYRHLLVDTVQNRIGGSVLRSSSNYVHKHTVVLELDLDTPGEWKSGPNGGHWEPKHARLYKLFESFREDVESLRQDLCEAIYTALEEEYEAITSDESLKDLSSANDYMFDRYGHPQ